MLNFFVDKKTRTQKLIDRGINVMIFEIQKQKMIRLSFELVA